MAILDQPAEKLIVQRLVERLQDGPMAGCTEEQCRETVRLTYLKAFESLAEMITQDFSLKYHGITAEQARRISGIIQGTADHLSRYL